MTEHEAKFEEEVTCPKCGNTHTMKGTTTVEIEPEINKGND